MNDAILRLRIFVSVRVPPATSEVTMRQRRIFAAVAVLLLLQMQTACFAYQPASVSNLAPGSNVRVQFASPAPVVVSETAREPMRYEGISGVQTIRGKFVSAVPDTLFLGRVYMKAPGIAPNARYHSAAVDISGAQTVEIGKTDPARTMFLVLGLSAAAAYVISTLADSISWNMGGVQW